MITFWKKVNKPIWVSVIVGAGVLGWILSPPVFYQEAFVVNVHDNDSGEELIDAIVISVWHRQSYHSYSSIERVTWHLSNKDGASQFNYNLFFQLPFQDAIHSSDPTIIVFKIGYEPYLTAGLFSGADTVRNYDASGRIAENIYLQTRDEQQMNIKDFFTLMSSTLIPVKGCWNRSYPELAKEVSDYINKYSDEQNEQSTIWNFC